jgi:phosphatidylglycerophosphate synthase
VPVPAADALLFATLAAAEGGPAAALPAGGTTLVRRLIDQLRTLGVAELRVLSRPEWAATVAEACGGAAQVDTAASLSEALRLAGETADAGEAPLVVADAHVLLHSEALAGLVADPRIGSGALVSAAGGQATSPFPVAHTTRTITSAASSFHHVERPTGSFLGVLKLADEDRAALAAAARDLAELAADPLPHELDDALGDRVAEAVEGGVALLLVGLVRSGVELFPADLRAFFYAAPRSRAAADAAGSELERHDEDAALLESAVKAEDSFFTTYLVSPYSKYLARFAARRGWTPNSLTVVSFVVGLAAAVAFALGSRPALVAGALLLQASFVLDCVDGQLARYTRTFSSAGAWLDSVFDRLKEYAVYAGLAVGSAHAFDDDLWVLAAAALTLQTVRHLIDVAYDTRVRGAAVEIRQPPLAQSRDASLGAELTFSTGVRAPATRRASRLARWAHRSVQLPIGERFALISVTAAVATPRVTFAALLAWGGVAAVYGFAGRIVLTAGRPRRVVKAVLN